MSLWVLTIRSSPQGADINCVDYKGNSPLLLATNCGAWKTVSLLLAKGELPNSRAQLSWRLCYCSGCALMHAFVLFRCKRKCERCVRLQLPSPGHPAAQRPEKHPRGSVAGVLRCSEHRNNYILAQIFEQPTYNNKTSKTSQMATWYDYIIIYIICAGVCNCRSYIMHHKNSRLHDVSVNVVD